MESRISSRQGTANSTVALHNLTVPYSFFPSWYPQGAGACQRGEQAEVCRLRGAHHCERHGPRCGAPHDQPDEHHHPDWLHQLVCVPVRNLLACVNSYLLRLLSLNLLYALLGLLFVCALLSCSCLHPHLLSGHGRCVRTPRMPVTWLTSCRPNIHLPARFACSRALAMPFHPPLRLHSGRHHCNRDILHTPRHSAHQAHRRTMAHQSLGELGDGSRRRLVREGAAEVCPGGGRGR